jgi:photosystem II stability/assembly factor-like uncharacterized protein
MVWGSSATDVWAVGFSGEILHFDGQVWTVVEGPTTRHLWAVNGTSASDVWAVGEDGVILHYDGTSWTTSAEFGAGLFLLDVWAASPTDAWVVGGYAEGNIGRSLLFRAPPACSGCSIGQGLAPLLLLPRVSPRAHVW